MSAPAVADIEMIDVLPGARATRVRTAGSGPALVFLHAEESADWSPLLDALAQSFTVYAPEVAATEDALATMDGLHDLLIYLLDVIDALGLDQVVLAGESFGAMVAAELAAIARDRVTQLVLVAPLGLWDDDQQVPDLYAAPPATLAARLFGDVHGQAAQAWLEGMQDKGLALARMRAMRTALHFVFPIPEIGLSRRAHRVLAPTLLVWGSADGVVPPAYADSFAALIPTTTLAMIDGGGHLLSADQPAATAAAITSFLAG